MTKNISQIERLLAYALVFLFPSQLALHFWPAYSLIFGIRVDYLAPTIYLTDLLIVAILTLWLKRDKETAALLLKRYWFGISAFLVLALANTYFSASQMPTLFKWLKILELSLFTLYIAVNKKTLGERSLLKALFYSLVFFGAVGVLQFFLGRTIGGPLYLLGERNFSITTPGIALAEFFGRDFLRAYSTFPHPNALAGFFGGSLIILYMKGKLKQKLWIEIGTLIITICLILSFSLTALLAFLGASFLFIVFWKSKNFGRITLAIFMTAIVFSVLFPALSSGFKEIGNLRTDVKERMELSILAGRIISQNFLFGSGFNTFVVSSGSPLMQPVHNIFLLLFSETGAAGLIIFALMFSRLFINLGKKKQYGYLLFFLFVVLTGLGDHYWLTLQQNLLLLSFISGLSIADIGRVGLK